MNRPTADPRDDKRCPPGLIPGASSNQYLNVWMKLEKSGEEMKHVKFNATNEMVDWAKWTWNPITGCLGPDKDGPCGYCYAKDIANRFYKEKFEPTFHPDRLNAPANTKIPKARLNESGIRNVFVCSMGDMFGEWVPSEWINNVFGIVINHPEWNFIFLTKNPKRYVDYYFPYDNAWIGVTVDIQARVKPAEGAFKNMQAFIKFVSVEPFQERITFNHLEYFDWVIIGGRSKSSGMPAFQPEWEWVEHLLKQAREAGCKVYFKPNLTVRPKEYPS